MEALSPKGVCSSVSYELETPGVQRLVLFTQKQTDGCWRYLFSAVSGLSLQALISHQSFIFQVLILKAEQRQSGKQSPQRH